MLGRAILAIALFAYAHQTEASEAEAANLCRGDAFRLCLSEIPDRERITACMQRRKAELSPGCKAVFNAPKRSPIVAAASK
ncbi:hypothetical protein MKK84_18835 [Methylobacterium sp. E-065]|uniref:hypothetical protein n=1 Tax=Methylobacterium sp. E-065 TaxID=2836583 RepID=UPI001FB8E86C|nr:hypothetical protein [Methylobacterium sp. E-065]MCJ2019468.1 hypothetical protein [Methylobacterium sp. E-065]